MIELDVTVPVPPLVFDTSWWPQCTSYGIGIYNNNSIGSTSNRIVVTNASITDDGSSNGIGTIRCTLASSLTASTGRIAGVFTSQTSLNPTLTVNAVAAGPTVRGKSTIAITVTGTVAQANMNQFLAEAPFVLTRLSGTGTSGLTCDAISTSGSDTVLQVETPAVEPSVGSTWSISRSSGAYTNFRDNDPTVSTLVHASTLAGTRQGQAYPLQRWMLPFDWLIPA
jgi:hypothetical protein